MKNYIVITILLFAILISGCGGGGLLQPSRTPTDTLRALNEATKKKDAEAIKKLLSKGTLVLIEKSAATQKTTADDLLTRDADSTFRDLPEIRGEKIEGDTASVEVKSELGPENEKIPLVKEDGEWKVALDKYVEDLKKRMRDDMNKPKPESENPANKQ